MTGPASATQCSRQWNRSCAQSPSARARSGSFVCSVQALTFDPGGSFSSMSSLTRAVAFSRVRTRSIASTRPSSTARIGFTASSEPKSAAPPEMRPDRRRYSRPSAAAMMRVLPARRCAIAAASSKDRPARRARAQAVAIRAMPPARVRESTTTIRVPSICWAVVLATEYVPESSLAIVSTTILRSPSLTSFS